MMNPEPADIREIRLLSQRIKQLQRLSYTVPPRTGSGSVADLRTLTSSSSTSDVRAFVITLVRDLKDATILGGP